jgi:hypothetical protein
VSDISFEIALLTYGLMEEHLMQHLHSFTKDKARDMANLVREKQSGEGPPSKKGKTFVSN